MPRSMIAGVKWKLVLLSAIVFIGCQRSNSASAPNESFERSSEHQNSESGAVNVVTFAPYAEVGIHLGDDEPAVLVRVPGSKLQELVHEPISRSVPDRAPARYEVLGVLLIQKQPPPAGPERIVLFRPWGRVKIGDSYQIVDFSKLRAEVRGLLEFVITSQLEE